MRVAVLVSLLVGIAVAAPPQPEWEPYYYHEAVGIKEAARIKAAEEAIDFDGSRIVGGSASSLGQYPHLGGLLISLPTGTSVCGSSLLTNTRAVTAAHCWWDGRNQALSFLVVLGSERLFSGGTRITTTNVQMHEQWNPSLISNDVAVISMSPVTYSNTIRNINLPSGSDLNNLFVGATAHAAGYGRQRDGTAGNINTNQVQHHVTLRVISNADCARFFGNSIIQSTICTDGSSRQSTCGGDSGGPLQIGTGTGATLIGITSFGFVLGCEWGWPAAFARVTSFESWIRARL